MLGNKQNKYKVYVICRPGILINRFWCEGIGSSARLLVNVNRAHKFSDLSIAKQVITLNKLIGFKIYAFDMMHYTLKEVK